MDWDNDAVSAAREAIQTVGDAVDTISAKAVHLEGLLVALCHAVKSGEMPDEFLEASLWLASDVVREIRSAVGKLR
jgi:hypothetical protein